MRKFNDVYTDKLNESIKEKENRVVAEYRTILEALMEDNNVQYIADLKTDEKASFDSKLSECFDMENGITEKGKSYLQNRKNFLTESSTTTERKEYLKERIFKVVEGKMYTQALKDGVYLAINDLYEGVNACKLTDALTIEEIEECICECVTQHVKNTLIKEFKNEIITD